MRKERIFAMAVCAFALAVGGTSCKKDSESPTPHDGELMTIGAGIAKSESGEKTGFADANGGDFTVNWKDGDQFSLYSGTNGTPFTIDEGQANKQTATFTGLKPGEAPYHAAYPTGMTFNGDKTFTYTITSEQQAFNGQENILNAGPMVGYSSDGASITFENAMSWIRIGLMGEGTVSKVTLSNNETATSSQLSGTLTVTVNENGAITTTTMAEGQYSLTATASAELGDTPSNFYFLVPEGAFKGTNGLKVEVFLEGEDEAAKTVYAAVNNGDGVEISKVYTATVSGIAPKPAVLPGEFTVSPNKTVYFSKGNLQAKYNGSTSSPKYTWSFAENQYGYIGDRAGNTTISGNGENRNPGDVVDLFGWSTDATYCGIHNSKSDDDYSGDFADWGANVDVKSGIGEGWFTLSQPQWDSLLNKRLIPPVGVRCTNCSLPGVAIGGVTYNGLFIYPDGYSGDEVSESSTWDDINAAGVVFLPCAGCRDGSLVHNVGTLGDYWSSTAPSSTGAYDLFFYSGGVDPANDIGRYYGFSVRLVRPCR